MFVHIVFPDRSKRSFRTVEQMLADPLHKAAIELHVYFTSMTCIPEGVFEMPNLHTLHVDANNLQTIPALPPNTSIRVFTYSHNPVSQTG